MRRAAEILGRNQQSTDVNLPPASLRAAALHLAVRAKSDKGLGFVMQASLQGDLPETHCQ